MIVGAKSKKKELKVNKINETLDQEDDLPESETNIKIILQNIESRDYSAAATFIDFIIEDLNVPVTEELQLWKGYSLFHMGEYDAAISLYQKMLEKQPENTILHLYIAACQFYNKDYEEAKKSAEKGPNCDYKIRLLFHIAQQLKDEDAVLQAHSQLVGYLENQMSLAAIHYLRANYQEAIDLYQKLLTEHPDYIALNVYIAMCLFKLEQYQESNDAVDQYLSAISDSAVALNLKSCDYFRLFSPEVAESQILQIKKFGSSSFTFVDGLIKHNLCVFKNGEDGLKIFPPLVGVIPEALLNLAVIHLKESNAEEAFKLLSDFQPIDVNDFILKGTSYLEYGQITQDPTLIQEANQIFTTVYQTDDIKDTVIGRCALTTTTFIEGNYEKTIKIMETYEHVMGITDEFQYNKGMSYASLGRWPEARVCFESVQNQAYKNEPSFLTWLSRCYIKTKSPEKAWCLYLDATNTEAANDVLQIIAADCYEDGFYLFAMRSYDILSKFEMDETMIDGMIASAIGAFKNIIDGVDPPDNVQEILAALNSDPKGEQYYNIIQQYVDDHPDQFMISMDVNLDLDMI